MTVETPRRAARWLVALLVVVAAVPLVVLWEASAPGRSGASQIPASQWPWPGSVGLGAEPVGECNEVFIAPANDYKNGFAVQMACQMTVPAKNSGAAGQFLPATLAPYFPVASATWYNSGWQTFTMTASDSECSIHCGAWLGNHSLPYSSRTGGLASGDCDPNYGQIPGGAPNPYVMGSSFFTGAADCELVNAPRYWAGAPDNAGAQSWASISHVYSLSLGPVVQCQGVHPCQSLQMIQTTWFNNDCQYQSNDLNAPCIVPAQGLENHTPCGTISIGADNSTWKGTQIGDPSGANGVGMSLYGIGGSAGTFPSWYNSAGYGSQFWLRVVHASCSELNSNVVQVQLPSDYYEGGSPTPATFDGQPTPCMLTGLVPGPVDYIASKGQTATFDYSGQVDDIAVDPNDNAGGTAITFGGSGSTVSVGSDSTVVPGTGSPQSVGYTPAKTGTFQANFYCQANGYVYPWGTSEGVANGSTVACGGSPQACLVPPSTGSLDACFAAAGWSLTDPVSWVVGALHDLVCIAQWAFVPPQSTLTGFVNLFSVGSSGTSSATVGQWLGALTTFTTSWPSVAVSQIQSAASGGCSVGPTISTPGGGTFSLCSSVAAAGGAASWTVIDTFVTALFAVMIGLALFHLVRRAISGNTA